MEDRSPVIKYLLIGLGIVAAFVLGLGLLFRTTDSAAAPARTAMSQQQQLMREALDMAKEAQRLQREHMREMQRAMQEAEEGFPGSDVVTIAGPDSSDQ